MDKYLLYFVRFPSELFEAAHAAECALADAVVPVFFFAEWEVVDLCSIFAHAGEPGVFVYGGEVVEIDWGHIDPLVGGCGYGVAAHDIEIAGEMACEVDSHFVYLCVFSSPLLGFVVRRFRPTRVILGKSADV